jgi:sugar lactone lactonase YvrE
VLETLAGVGLVGDDSNDWDPACEGALAVECELSTPHDAMGDADGNTYIADKEAHAIRKVTPDGVITTVAGMNEPGDDGDEPGPATERHLNWPNGLFVKPDGTTYVLELGSRKVRRLDVDGTLSTLFSVPELAGGRGLWVAEDESLAYVGSSNRVLAWTPEGGVTTFADGFVQLGHLDVDPGGELTVTDRGAHRVLRVDEGGIRTPIAGDGRPWPFGDGERALDTSLNEVRGIARADTGGFFLGTHAGNQVHYLDTYGYVHLLIDGAHDAHAGDGESLATPGSKVSEVRNVRVNPQGELLVTEHDHGFVRVARRAEN